METLWALFNIKPRKQENEQRTLRIYASKKKLDTARDKYRLAINNRRLEARKYAREGHQKLARNALIMRAIYAKNLDTVADLLMHVERIIAARERADLLVSTGSVMKDIVVWLQQTVTAMEKESPLKDQAAVMDEMFRKIDRVQVEVSQATVDGIRQDLSPAELAAINDELLDMCEYDDTDENALTDTAHDEDVYMDEPGAHLNTLPRRTHSLLLEEDASA